MGDGIVDVDFNQTPRMNIDQSHLLMTPEPLEPVVEETKEEKPVSVLINIDP